MSLARSALTVSAMTMASRVAGFARDWLMALTLGAGPAADAFFVAFKLPNFFRRLFAEGAFSAAFVPYFSAIHARDHAAGEAFARRVLSIFLPVLVLFIVVVELFMPAVVYGLTGGFKDGNAQKLALAIELSRLTFPFLALISIVSLLSGILNGLSRFAAAAGVPVVLNLCLMSAMLLAPLLGSAEPRDVARFLAAGVTIAGMLQVLMLLAALRRAGFALPLGRPSLSPNVVNMLKAMAPAAIGAGAVQINLLIDVLLATRYLPEGSISYLYYGDRLVQLPIGVIGVAVGTALLPSLARTLSIGDAARGNRLMNTALEMVLVITLPAMVALMTVPEVFIRILFEHGAFERSDTLATVRALMAYACGLPAYVMIKVFTPGFFARGDTKTPVRISIACLVLNTALGAALMQGLGHAGLALATAAAAWVNALSLWFVLAQRGHFRLDSGAMQRSLRTIAAAGVMAAGLYAVTQAAAAPLGSHPIAALPTLICIVVIAMALYVIAGTLLRAFDLARVRQALTRRG
ncbi:MAG: murein biosynthesis integral membrane protein MurJ [Pseudomonadota bacterium]